MKTGLIKDVLGIMKLNSDKLDKIDKLTVLLFDEVKICNKTEYNVHNDKLVNPHDQMQVVMAQSITSKWKQPVYFNVNENITKAVLCDIIDKLDEIGFKVICCVTNCGIKNVRLWNQLKITYTNPTFFTPSGRKIVYIPDSSHLLELTRNWFLGTGFCLNGAEMNKKPLEALITKAPSEVCHCVKLKEEHLTCDEGPQQKNIKLAKELLSHSTATSLLHCGPIEDFQLLHTTADFIKLISNWFDLVNVSQKHDSNEYNSPFGLFSYKQNKFLNKVYNTINSMRCKGSNYINLQIFQKGILMHINGLKQLLQISEENGLNYLLTANINKDPLENVLQQLSSIDDPSLNAVKKLKMIILGIAHDESNIIDNNHEEYMFSQTFKSLNLSLNDEDKKDNSDVTQKSDSDLMSENEFVTKNIDKNENEIELDTIEYLAGWVALKHKSKIPEIGYMATLNNSNNSFGQNKMPSWMVDLPYNEVMIPSNDFKKIIFRVEHLFNKFTKCKMFKDSKLIAKLTKKIVSRMAVEKKFKAAIRTYIEERMNIRINFTKFHKKLLKQNTKFKKREK